MLDLDNALELFQDSLETLTNSFSRVALQQGINHEMVELHRAILKKFDNGSGQASGKRNEIAKFAKSQGRGKDWDALCQIKLADGSMLVEQFVDCLIIKPTWEGDAP